MKAMISHTSEAGYWEVETTIIARHATRKGWSIGIYHVMQPTPHFQVVRIDETGCSLVLKRTNSEIEARKVANQEWLGDMGRAVSTMIACGPLAI